MKVWSKLAQAHPSVVIAVELDSFGAPVLDIPTRPHRDPRGISPSCQGRAYNNPLLVTGFQDKFLREFMLLILTPRPQTITPHNVQTSNLQ